MSTFTCNLPVFSSVTVHNDCMLLNLQKAMDKLIKKAGNTICTFMARKIKRFEDKGEFYEEKGTEYMNHKIYSSCYTWQSLESCS